MNISKNTDQFSAFIKGEVLHQGSGLRAPEHANCNAALKLPTTFDHDEVEQFVRELDALILIGPHPHVITFFGWTLYNEIPALITELAQTDLLSYVRELRGHEIPIKTILSILWQITQALDHLASLMMVHRDVACRNILLTETKTAKLADFGLCCHCDESFTYRASLQKRLPLKWLAIESLVNRMFSEKTDVWSLAVMCYEIFTFGAVPYPALTNIEMLEFLRAGNRLEQPPDCPKEIYEIMLSCWREQPLERPTFKEIGNTLRAMLENETASYGYLSLDMALPNNNEDD